MRPQPVLPRPRHTSTIAPAASSPPPLPPPSSPPPSPPTTSSSNYSLQQLQPPVNLLQPSKKKKLKRSLRLFKLFRSVFQSFPVFSPACRLPQALPGNCRLDGHVQSGVRMTGTLFGYRRARISLSLQDNSRCLPLLLLELAMPTTKLLQEMGSGLVRIALESEKRPDNKIRLMEEPVWTMYCNGRKTGYAAKREATDDDLHVMQILHAVSMGAGVVPGDADDSPDGEMTYMRAHFERVVGSRDSETYYMMNPDGNSGPELSIFFVRI